MPKRVDHSAGRNAETATTRAASYLTDLVRSLVAHGQTHAAAQQFALQSAALLFAEDVAGRSERSLRIFVRDGLTSNGLTFPTFPNVDTGRVLDVPSLFFSSLPPISITHDALHLLNELVATDWTQVHPGVLGTILQSTQRAKDRHRAGAHYTPNHAILEHILEPTFLEPWRARLHRATTLEELVIAYKALATTRILDPACGSGNFLYEALVALHRVRNEIVACAKHHFSFEIPYTLDASPGFGLEQLFGIDSDPLAVSVTKIVLWLGHCKQIRDATKPSDKRAWILDTNIRCADALFCEWPKADLILGNPPFQSKNRMQQEFGPEYVQRLRQQYPDVPGRADYCVYWFRRTHDELAPGARAGLVGTNTIRENDSRKGGLDYVVKHGGTITDAVSSMVWPGEAIVHVSVVNWIKGASDGPKRLSWQEGDSFDSPWHETRLSVIPASLSRDVDVTGAETLQTNAQSGMCFQGQTHGHEGFLLSHEEATAMVHASKKNQDVIQPYLVGDDLLSNMYGRPSRWVIDFFPRELLEARAYALPFQRVKTIVLPDRETAAREEKERNEQLSGSGNHHHGNFLKRWWQLSYPRGELMTKLRTLSRYVVCSRVTKRPVFEFVHSSIHPSDALAVFPLEDDYSFGILQSAMHWAWFTARCSTLTARFRYTSDTVFDSFPWPQSPTKKQCVAVAKAAAALRNLRGTLAKDHGLTLRAMYASMEEPGEHPLKNAQAALDKAVRAAYAMPSRKDPLAFLLELNQACARKEAQSELIMGPGLPTQYAGKEFVTADCIRAEPLSA